MLRIRVLGHLEVSVDEHLVPLPPSRRGKALLSWLASHPGRHSRMQLAAQFWPDVLDSSARTSLRGALAELRRCLGPAADALVATRDSVELSTAAVEVDLCRFRSALRESRWSEALQHDTGPLLADFDEEWAERSRDEHAADILLAVTRLAEECEAKGDLQQAVAMARRRVRLDPLSEVAGRELVRLLAADGDRAAALDAGRELTERLRSELGVEPDSRTLAVLTQLRVPSTRHNPWHGVSASPVVTRAPRDLVGRSGALEQIREVRSGDSGRVVVLRGDAGIGKTALALASARQAHEDGTLVLYGRCDEEAIVPYGPWVEALGQVFDQLDQEQSHQVAADGGAELARLFPQLGSSMDLIAAPLAEPDTLRWRLFEVIATVVSKLAVSRPVLLVFDDVHWADHSSLLLLRHLLRTRSGAPITVLLTMRDAETPREAPVHEALAQLRREEPVTRLDLAGLDEQEVAELVRRRRGALDPHDGFVRTLYEETEGNPFFVEEILRNIPGTPAAHGPAARTSFDVPDGVRDLVRRRLERLDDNAQAVLTLASVMGRDFELSVLEHASNLDSEQLLDAVDAAVEASLIDEVAVGRYSFAHALIRSALYESLSKTRRARHHVRVAQALEGVPSKAPGARAGELAHHYLEGGNTTQIPVAVASLQEAHRRAMEQFAYGEAAAHAERAVRAVEAAPDGLDGQLPSLLLALGEAQSRSGDYHAARAAFARAAEEARATEDGSLLGKAALGFAGPSWRNFGFVDESGIALLDEALSAVPGELLVLRTRLQARLAIALYFARQPARVAQLTEAAVGTARALDDVSVLMAALEARLWETWRPDAVSVRLETADELLRVASVGGAAEVAAMARRWRVVALLELARMDDAWVEVSRHAEDARRLQLPYELMYAAVFDTMRALLDGRLEDAAAASAQVAAFGELRGGADALQFGGVHALTFAHLGGDLTPIVEGLQQFAAGYPALPAWRGALAYALAVVGREADAARELNALWPPEENMPLDAVWLPGLVFASLAVVRLGDSERARHLYHLLAGYARRPVVLGAGGAVWATVSLYLAELADLTGDVDAAQQHRAEATEDLEIFGATSWAASARPGARRTAELSR